MADMPATKIAVWNQVVLPAIVAELLADEVNQDALLKASLQLAEDIFNVNNPGTRPPWAKAILKD